MELAVFAIVLVGIFAAKVASVVLTRDELVGMSTTFSWADPSEGAELPARRAEARTAKVPVRAYARRRPGIA